MRRALEKLHFPGYWILNSEGDYVGINGDYIFRYDVNAKKDNLYEITAYKKNRWGDREVRLSQYCSKHCDKKNANQQIQEFMQFVVMKNIRKK
jgi:hypothetical protein